VTNLVSVCRLAKDWNPLKKDPWCKGLNRGLVAAALHNLEFCTSPVAVSVSAEKHAARIAFLILNEDATPIEIDVGVPHMGCHVEWIIEDGNHRLAAAIFRKDEYIKANISGSTAYASELLGIDNPYFRVTKRPRL
jgi:hypothetical protein